MKTKLIFSVFILNLISCNIGFNDEKPGGEQYDVIFCNEADANISILTFVGTKNIDRIDIAKTKSKKYNNVTYKPNSAPKNVVFEFNPWPDSSIIISHNIYTDSNGKYKKYILQYCPSFPNNTNCSDSIPKWVLLYGRKNGGIVKDRKWYSLNKGSSLFKLVFENSDFENSKKMYDFVKRGL